jgi:hypothetical protein
MNIIILTLFSYIFNPSITEVEQDKIIQKFNISFAIKRIPSVNFKDKELIKLYNSGKYKKYINLFNKNIKKFIYVKDNPKAYSKLYLYYTLSLKILSMEKEYQNSLCIIRGGLNNFENLPSFVLKEMPDQCNNLKEISINQNDKNIQIYINGLLIESEIVYVNGDNYNLSVCKDNSCKYLRTKSSKIDKIKYNDYFTWDIKKGLFISNTIPDSFFQYYNVNQIHYFYKKDNDLFHKVKLDNGVIILEEKIILDDIDDKKIVLNKDDTNAPKKQSAPIYKKWYFYAGIVTIIGITAGGIYWLQQDTGTNTSVTWQ